MWYCVFIHDLYFPSYNFNTITIISPSVIINASDISLKARPLVSSTYWRWKLWKTASHTQVQLELTAVGNVLETLLMAERRVDVLFCRLDRFIVVEAVAHWLWGLTLAYSGFEWKHFLLITHTELSVTLALCTPIGAHWSLNRIL